MNVDLDNLVQQFKDTLETAKADLREQELAMAAKRGQVQALERAYNALAGKPKGAGRVKRDNGIRSQFPGGLKAKVEEVLNGSDTAMDLGALARAIFGIDDSKHRTRISAAVSPVVQDPQGSIRRIGIGSYTTRQA